MMTYPEVLLPNSSRKLIDCDLSNFYLVRIVYSSDIDKVWDKKTNQVKIDAFCSPREHIYDLSTNLLGIFDLSHCAIRLTNEGKQKYSKYCLPNESVVPPQNPEHFYFDEEISKVFANVKVINNTIAECENEHLKDRYVCSAYVCHTPMLWNFWHCSIRWHIIKKDKHGIVTEVNYENLSNTMRKNIAFISRANIAYNFSLDVPDIYEIPNTCYEL